MDDPNASRAPHPDDARESLRQWAHRRDAHQREAQALKRDLGDLAQAAMWAGLHKIEIAQIAGVARTTLDTAIQTRESRG